MLLKRFCFVFENSTLHMRTIPAAAAVYGVNWNEAS